jgi:hypothetical protein
LCSPAPADRSAVESLLFDAFIPAAYRNDPAGRWKAQDAERWLVFLARHLERTIASPDLAWWQLPLAVPGFAIAAGIVFGAAVGAAFGAAVGAAFGAAVGAGAGAGAGAMVGAGAGAMVGVVATVGVASEVGVGAMARAARMESPKPVRGISLRSLGRSVVAVAVGGLVAGGVAGAALVAAFVAAFGVVAGAEAATAFVVVAVAAFGVVARPATRVVARGAAGAAAGAVFGAAFRSFTLVAWAPYEIARIWLALRHRLPWQLKGFLADAHRRGVLRQAGSVYQFRHIELQHRLGARR